MKRTMIKLLAVFAVSALFFASCKEDNPVSGGGDQEALNVAISPRVSFFVPVNFGPSDQSLTVRNVFLLFFTLLLPQTLYLTDALRTY